MNQRCRAAWYLALSSSTSLPCFLSLNSLFRFPILFMLFTFSRAFQSRKTFVLNFVVSQQSRLVSQHRSSPRSDLLPLSLRRSNTSRTQPILRPDALEHFHAEALMGWRGAAGGVAV